MNMVQFTPLLNQNSVVWCGFFSFGIVVLESAVTVHMMHAHGRFFSYFPCLHDVQLVGSKQFWINASYVKA